MGTFTVTTPGDGTFVAAAPTVVFEMWGGHGLPSLFAGGKGGAGGGARTKKTVTGLTVGATYNYHVGDEGEDTWIIDATTGKAVCGGAAGGTNQNTNRFGGIGGAAASCIGDPDESFSGGDGGAGAVTGGRGGGGGAGAGSAANGGNATSGGGAAPGTGGTAPTGGGNGGTGGAVGQPGAAGNSPGGAPGGGASGQPSGAKSAGKIIATWVDPAGGVVNKPLRRSRNLATSRT